MKYAFLFVTLAWLGTTAPAGEREYRLRLYHTHTNERLEIVYRHGERYDTSALLQLNRFLRDHRTGEVHEFDPRLFDLLFDLTRTAGHANTEIQVICGYRSRWSNEFLRTTTSGVSQNSLHMRAEAIDIRLAGVKTSDARRAALRLARGGVGYYPDSNFIHVDIGRVRRW